MGITALSGVLLEGNSGCGKTLIAQSIAQSCRATFIGVSVIAISISKQHGNLSLCKNPPVK
jgi:ATP-dependent 26S proteasome regulatory subunit